MLFSAALGGTVTDDRAGDGQNVQRRQSRLPDSKRMRVEGMNQPRPGAGRKVRLGGLRGKRSRGATEVEYARAVQVVAREPQLAVGATAGALFALDHRPASCALEGATAASRNCDGRRMPLACEGAPVLARNDTVLGD